MSEKEICIAILVGGLGTRLKPITEIIPKPMVSICGKPFLEYQIKQIKNCGIKNIIFCVGYLGEKVKEYFGDGENFGVNISYSYEKELLGTAGAIKNAESLIKTDSFLVLNGDTYLNIDFRNLFSFHEEKNFPVTMAVTSATNPQEQELVEVEDNTIIKFYKRNTPEHKEHIEKNPNPLINAGAYAFNKSILDLIPAEKKVSLEQEIFPQLIKKIIGFKHNGYIKDIANIQFCREFEKDILEGNCK